MARKKCKGCGQFAGAGPRCPAVAIPQPASVDTPRSALAPAPINQGSTVLAPASRFVYTIALADGEARKFAAFVENAMRTPRDSDDAKMLLHERQAIEERFGPIDWAA